MLMYRHKSDRVPTVVAIVTRLRLVNVESRDLSFFSSPDYTETNSFMPINHSTRLHTGDVLQAEKDTGGRKEDVKLSR